MDAFAALPLMGGGPSRRPQARAAIVRAGHRPSRSLRSEREHLGRRRHCRRRRVGHDWAGGLADGGRGSCGRARDPRF
eukprot:11199039-Lingulodinium_polyedra.AAC.1